ncbi:MAG: DUF512 domain-containing protein, partial [Oscillospiraceae bacterium]|nr:DUF512 domain-containing protein [Oscillospiraceae bacterium]
GLSRHRKGLYPLTPFTARTAGEALDLIERFQAQFLAEHGTRAVFPSDEFFLMAGREIPDAAYYEDYPQYENGVGLLRSLADEFHEALPDAGADHLPRSVSIATGRSPYGFLRSLADEAEAAFPGLTVHMYPIRNDFFGEMITVTGLITGQDLIAQLRGQHLGEELLLSSAMIRRDSEVFLDDYTISDVEQALQTKVRLVRNDGYEFLDALLGVQY